MKKSHNVYRNIDISPRFVADAELDFHARGVLLPYDVEKLLNEFLEDSHIANKSQVLIITGKGNVVRPLVQRLLFKHPLVRSFQQAGYFNGQSGAFEVTIK